MNVDLKEIFGKRIKIEPKVRSISGIFFSEESLEQTNYQPSYQRNYVWDDEKASYFIESIFLGTEIPPLIYFKSVKDDSIRNEIIDGRQRYQSILNFVQGELKLKKSGLQKLADIPGFAGKTYNELSDELKATFEDTKIRIIEYSFLYDHTIEEEESVKKEIFQRYNSGITPLKSSEIDKAQYLDNDLNSYLKSMLSKDKAFDEQFTIVFRLTKSSTEQKVMKMRELLVLYKIPISYFATQKQKVIRKYFDLLSEKITEEDMDDLYKSMKRKLSMIAQVEKHVDPSTNAFNRLVSECLFWALTIVEEELEIKVALDVFQIQRLANYIIDNKEKYKMERSSFAKVLIGRYECISHFFNKEFNCNFNIYLYNYDEFKKENRKISTTTDSYDSLSFDELRINKPEPTSVEVIEFLRTIKNGRFLIRPPYQRGEVKNRKKSSSIIESLLLGIKLPPIFVYKRSDGVSEVIDGQQRLLSIIGFMGETYLDENGEVQYSMMSEYTLDLKDNGILKDLHGSTYSELSKSDQNKIKTSDIWVIEINGRINKNFDPVDLFIRLNNKPYPIPKDSFEMWNSFASRLLIDTIKKACSHNMNWFYLRKNNARMDNENLFTTLAYFQYLFLKNGMKPDNVAPERTIEIFKIERKINCRFRLRYDISKLMEQEDHTAFIEAINQLEFGLIKNVAIILNDVTKTVSEMVKALDDLLDFDSRKRTQMMFYVLWILLHDLSRKKIEGNIINIKTQIRELVKLTSDCEDVESFRSSVISFRELYTDSFTDVSFRLNDVASIYASGDEECSVQMLFEPSFGIDGRFPVQSISGKVKIQKHQLGIHVSRAGIMPRYVECFLRSMYFSSPYRKHNQIIGTMKLGLFEIPFVSVSIQKEFCKILDYVDLSSGLEKKYFERVMDLMVLEHVYKEEFAMSNICITNIVRDFPDLQKLEDDNERKLKLANVYSEHVESQSEMSVQLLKAIDLTVAKTMIS